ncbi:hypothetical protein AAHE18_13G052700 [Arachis hypogaea]
MAHAHHFHTILYLVFFPFLDFASSSLLPYTMISPLLTSSTGITLSRCHLSLRQYLLRPQFEFGFR